MQFLIAYGLTLFLFLLIDALWIGVIAKDFYFSALREIIMNKPNLLVALGFYILYCGGIVYFALAPAMLNGQWTTALVNGAILGIIAYATYDLTNLALIKDWPVKVAVVDIIWGGALTASSATGAFFAMKILGLISQE